MTTPRLTRLAFVALALGLFTPAVARAQKVLLIADDDAAGTGTLKTALAGAGMTVTQTTVPSQMYDGTNPAPAGFDVIVLLAGTANSRATDMPAGGQSAIVSFVNAGGGLVNTEWAAYQVSNLRWQTLKPLVLLSRNGGTIGLIDYKVDPNFQNHPLWAKLPATFTVSMASNVGSVIAGPGVVRIATSVAAGDVVVFRDLLNNGRVVEISTAGNYTNGLWGSTTMQQLLINASTWASKSRVNRQPVADAGGPYMVDEGGSIKLNGLCTDPDMDQPTYAWDFQGNGLFVDATGPNPTFSAAALDGPQTIMIGLKCTDSGGLSATKTVALTVRNVSPQITSMPPLAATESSPYVYNAMVVDPGPADMPKCTLTMGPMGMSVQASSCKVQWTPTYDQARAAVQPVTVTVTDKDGGTSMQSWTINVALIDADKDGLPDTWEMLYFNGLIQTPGGDPDMDGRPNLKEYQDGTDPSKYDGPSAPAIVSPDKGVHAPTRAMLTVTNATSPTKDPLVYQFEIYSDAQLMQLVDVNLSVLEGMGQTVYVPQMLQEDKHYWYRVRARDAYVAGPWTPVATFFASDVHQPPTAPAILMPLNQSKIKDSKPLLQVQNARSSDEYALTYTFELYEDMDLKKPVESMSGIPEGGKGVTSYQVTKELIPYNHYWWRARATDSMNLDGDWSQVVSFHLVPTNSPPDPPMISFPKDGDRINNKAPVFMLGGSKDPDEEPLVYICELDVGVDFSSMKLQMSGSIPPGMNNEVTWTPMSLDENQRYCLRCRAQDTSGTSGWSQVCFLIDTMNDPPTVPKLQNPSDGGMAGGDVVRFTWINSVDPEGDPIRYDVEVYTDDMLTMRVVRGQGDDGPTGLTLVGIPAGTLFWRARAVDVLGAASEWSRPNKFTDAQTPGGPIFGGEDPNGMKGCGCRLGARGQSGAGAALFGLMGIGMALLRRRRQRPSN